jgi:hypothetical protein
MTAATPLSSLTDDWLAGTVRRAAMAKIELAPDQSAAITAQVTGLKTVGDAQAFISGVTAALDAMPRNSQPAPTALGILHDTVKTS